MACFFAQIKKYKIEKTDKDGILNKKYTRAYACLKNGIVNNMQRNNRKIWTKTRKQKKLQIYIV